MAKKFDELIWDYVIFIGLIITTTIAPLWGNFMGGKEKKVTSKADYVFATGKVSMFAMMLSIARGTLGVRSFLGFPSELYYRGAEMWETLYGYVNAYPVVCFVFIPVYFNLGITSAYQYLDMRFKSKLVRCLASACFILRQILNLGVTVYTPTVALNTVIGIPYWISLVGITVISIVFNLLGGLKHAIKADVIQTFTMIAVTIVIIIQGFYKGGGVQKSIEVTQDSGRLEFFNWTGDMTVRVDTFSAWLGQLFISMSLFGCQQNFIQRYLSMSSLNKVTKMMMSNIPVIIVLFSLSWIAGIGIFATYFDCDPLKANITRKKDELLPYFVEDQFDYLPGFIGLFMATLFNGALALNVSNLNSLATVTWEDFLSKMPRFRSLKERQQLNIIKFVGVVYGVLIMGVGFSVGLLSGVIESQMLMTSSTSGPLLGAFLLAILFPMANWKGTATGMIVAQILTTWVVFGNFAKGQTKKSILETRTDGCHNDTLVFETYRHSYNYWIMNSKPQVIQYEGYSDAHDSSESMGPLTQLYSVSYMYYSVFGTLLTVSVGIIVSYLTQSKEDAYESRLIHPLILRFSRWLPGKQRYFTDDDVKKPDGTAHDNLAYESSEIVETVSEIPADEEKKVRRKSVELEIAKTIVPSELYRKITVD